MLSLRLLGPVSLLRDGQPRPLPTHKAQALLLLALGGPSHRARLATWLWPLTDDSASRRNLRRELARLRDAGAGDALLTQGEVLTLAPGVQCDALAFATLADAGQATQALALWRGPLADGLQTGATEAFDDWLAAERRRLATRRRRRQLLAAGCWLPRPTPPRPTAICPWPWTPCSSCWPTIRCRSTCTAR